MRISTFRETFTKELESFVQTPIQMPVLNEWDPHGIAAPERHLANGKGRDVDELLYLLDSHNQAFERIGSMLRIFLDRRTLKSAPTLDPVKEQVWLFGYRWFSTYYEMLTEPDILRSEFYRTYHDEFLSLMGKMLALHPSKRIRPIDALQCWFPDSRVFAEVESESDTEKEKEITTAKDGPSTTPPTPSETPPPSSSTMSVSSRRLVLTGPAGLWERNKTRKNLHN